METHPVARLLSQFWWLMIFRGVMAILFGVCTIAWPGLTLVMLALFVGAYAFVDGVVQVIHAVGYRRELEHWVLMLIEGLFGIAFGILTFMAPELTTAVGGLIIAFYIAAWAIVTGVIRIALAVRLRKEIEGEWLLVLSGVVSILLGVIIMARPAVGVLGLLYLIAFWSISLGIILIMLALKAKKFRHVIQQSASANPI